MNNLKRSRILSRWTKILASTSTTFCNNRCRHQTSRYRTNRNRRRTMSSARSSCHLRTVWSRDYCYLIHLTQPQPICVTSPTTYQIKKVNETHTQCPSADASATVMMNIPRPPVEVWGVQLSTQITRAEAIKISLMPYCGRHLSTSVTLERSPDHAPITCTQWVFLSIDSTRSNLKQFG